MSNQTPSILKMGEKRERRSLSRIETRILDPMYINDNTASFQLPTTGILDKNTTLILPVLGADANQKLPLTTGILSLIKNARLSCNGVIISNAEEVGMMASIRLLFRPIEIREHRDACELGTHTGIEQSTNRSTLITESKVRITGNYNTANPQAGTLDSGYQLTNNAGTSPHYYVKLQHLFPELLNNVMIPLGLLSHPLQLDITFSGNGIVNGAHTASGVSQERIIAVSGQSITGCTVQQSQVKLKLDLLYFNDGTMSKLAQQATSKEGIQFVYGDYSLVRTQIQALNPAPAGTAFGTQTATRNIGYSNQILRHLLIATPKTKFGANNQDYGGTELTNKYSSTCGVSTRGEKIQITINSIPIYPRAIDNEAQLQSELSDIFNTPIHIPACATNKNCAYGDAFTAPPAYGIAVNAIDANNRGFSNDTLHGYSNDILEGELCYKGFDFTKPIYDPASGQIIKSNYSGSGIRINENPVMIEYERQCNATENAGIDMYIFGCIERQFILRNGLIYVTGSA